MPKDWIYDYVISDYEAFIFYNALYRHHDEYYYHPIALAKREEVGIKYRFLCIAMPGTNPLLYSHFADIEIYKPIKGMPYISCLYRFDFDDIFSRCFPYR